MANDEYKDTVILQPETKQESSELCGGKSGTLHLYIPLWPYKPIIALAKFCGLWIHKDLSLYKAK